MLDVEFCIAFLFDQHICCGLQKNVKNSSQLCQFDTSF